MIIWAQRWVWVCKWMILVNRSMTSSAQYIYYTRPQTHHSTVQAETGNIVCVRIIEITIVLNDCLITSYILKGVPAEPVSQSSCWLNAFVLSVFIGWSSLCDAMSFIKLASLQNYLWLKAKHWLQKLCTRESIMARLHINCQSIMSRFLACFSFSI